MRRVFESLTESELERRVESRILEVEAEDLSEVEVVKTGLECLEQVALLRPKPAANSRLVALTDRQSLGAEKFRQLSLRLKHLQRKGPLKKVLLTSGVGDEGKSLIAANLAVSLACDNNQKVLLLGGDLRQPILDRHFGVNGLKGLSEYLQGDQPATDFIYRVDSLQLWLLPAGSTPAEPLELLQSPRLSQLLAQLTGWFDWLVIDSPPLLLCADAGVWARMADGTLLVIRQGKTSKKLLQSALENLDNSSLLGVILNEWTDSVHKYYEKYYRT